MDKIYCARCEKLIENPFYWNDDDCYCENCMGLLEYQFQAAWEAQKESYGK